MSDLAWAKLVRLRDCLCDAINASDLDPVCMCAVVPGAGVALDFIHSGCKGGADGMAWVRLTNEYPTVSFPQAAAGPTKCGAEIAVVAEVGLVRSMPIPEDGEPPDAATYQAVAEVQIEEAALMRKAIVCCFGSAVILGVYTPVGPVGGAIGGLWQATIPTAEDDDE